MKYKFLELRNLHQNKMYEYERNKLSNERIGSLEKELNKINSKLNIITGYRVALSSIIACTKDRYGKYQTAKLEFIEDSLSDVINLIFPDTGLTPKISTTDKRNLMRSELLLVDSNGNVRYPRITEGGFMKQLIGFVSAIKVIQLIGANTLFMDESFSDASSVKKEQVTSVINEYLKEGLQLILISQYPECYDKLPRREFILKSVDGCCKLMDVVDYEGEV